MTVPIRSGPYRTFHRLQPHESYLEFEGSTITIPLRARMTDNSPWMHDEVKLKAYMRLEVFPSYVNGLGTREFQFIIRDWDLYGTCPLLNKLFYGHPLGRELDPDGPGKKVAAPERLPAVLTFCVSNNYSKEGDPENDILGPVDELEIRNLTSHDLRSADDAGDGSLLYGNPGNSLYWEVVESSKLGSKHPGFTVMFYKRPPRAGGAVPALDRAKERESVLATVEVDKNGTIEAQLSVDSYRRAGNVAKLTGNTVISPLHRPRTPIQIRWKLGRKPRAGRGRIRIVSPARSLCTAEQRPEVGMPFDSADFPARLIYAINYHIHVNRERFVEDQAGIAIAVGATEIPPRDVTVAFDKPHMGTVLGKYLEFGPGHCTGMHEITEDEYTLGARICRYWRTVPLGLVDPVTPFDPFRDY